MRGDGTRRDGRQDWMVHGREGFGQDVQVSRIGLCFAKKCEADVMMNSSQSKNGCWFPSYSQEILKRCLLMFSKVNSTF